MNFKINITVTLLLIFNVVGGVYCQQNNIKFAGTFKDSTHTATFQDMYVSYTTDGNFSAAGSKTISIKIDSNGRFNLDLPDRKMPYFVSFDLRGKVNSVRQPLWRVDYLCGSGDNINMTVNISVANGNDYSVVFSGAGSAKFELVEQLNDQLVKKYYAELNSLSGFEQPEKDLSGILTKFNQLAILLRRYKAQKTKLINNAGIDEISAKLIYHEIANYDNEWSYRIKLVYEANPNYRKQIAEIYRQHRAEFLDKIDDYGIQTISYESFYSVYDAFDMAMKTYSDKVDIVDFYNHTKSGYSGLVRERLLYNCFSNQGTKSIFKSYTPELKDSLMKDALTVIKTPYVLAVLNEEITKAESPGVGTKVFESSFFDTKGKVFNLKSLAGKVILIDIYFKGCVGCAESNKVFEKELYPKYINNKKFEVMSISIDKTRQLFLSGVASKLYTPDKGVEVWTGNGVDHPFLKHYKVTGTPFLMIVDTNGNIVYKPDGGTSTLASVKEKIDEALKGK